MRSAARDPETHGKLTSIKKTETAFRSFIPIPHYPPFDLIIARAATTSTADRWLKSWWAAARPDGSACSDTGPFRPNVLIVAACFEMAASNVDRRGHGT